VGAGARVTVVDNLESGSVANLARVRSQIEFIEGDVTDLAQCREWFDGQELVLNLAAQAPGVGHSHLNHVGLLGRNLQIGSVVLEAARAVGVRRVLVVSSSCVYPDDAPAPTPELPVFTGEPERANSGYGWAKRYQELQAMHYAQQFGLEIALVRPFNAYGGRDLGKGERSHVIPALIERLLADSPEVVVWGSGNQTRSFIHALDVARAMLAATESYAVCDPLNLGPERETSMRELIHLLMDLAGVRKRVVFDTTKPEGAKRKGADVTKLRRVLPGFTEKIGLRTGLLEMIDAHRQWLASRARQSR
jgi:GDP-L-fucose synthase